MQKQAEERSILVLKGIVINRTSDVIHIPKSLQPTLTRFYCLIKKRFQVYMSKQF